MRHLVSNIEVAPIDNEELAIQAKRELYWWVGRTTHRPRRVAGELKMCRKKVVL